MADALMKYDRDSSYKGIPLVWKHGIWHKNNNARNKNNKIHVRRPPPKKVNLLASIKKKNKDGAEHKNALYS